MPLATLLVPPALPVAAALGTWCLGRAGVEAGRWPCAVSVWLAMAVLGAGWSAIRVPVEVPLPLQVGAAVADVRLDALTVALQLVVLLGLALLLTFQPWNGGQAALAALAAASAVIALASGSLGLTALGTGVTGSLCLLGGGDRPRALTLTAGWLALLWAAVSLQVVAGTALFSAVPVSGFQLPVFLLLLLTAALLSGAVPWPTWVGEAAGTPAVVLLVPLGFFPLLRAYGLGAGQWPQGWLHPAVVGLGAATALAAAVRAGAAPTPRRMLAEAVPASAGLALMALGLGTVLGVAATVTVLGGLGLLGGLVPLVPERGRLLAAGVAVAVGLPPTLVFGGWLLTLQAALNAGVGFGFAALAGALAWLLLLAAGARALRLPPEPGGSSVGSMTGVGLALGMGVALGVLVEVVVVPAAIGLMTAGPHPPAVPVVTGGPLALVTAAGGWDALLLGGPFAAIAVVLMTRGGERVPATVPPPPLLDLGMGRLLWRLPAWPQLPPQPRRLLQRLPLLEAAAAASHPWFWALLSLALALVVVR
jgi:formate hydrogenlyase subunit 3/multisubunit Na+/H+ antiporter MnhD subunit